MPRHMSTEAYQMDLRTSTSQQQLNPSRSSSLESGQDELDGTGIEPMSTATGLAGGPYGFDSKSRPHKVDLYSIPVFCLELIVLAGLAFAAYFIHFQYQHEPLISGFYCDDVAFRQQPIDSLVASQFSKLDNELTVVVLLIAIPIVIIVFCELVNSMFGALKFRQISALCACCKLHSITRRTFRFSGAYLLGFLIVMISCDILANTTGHLKPYFAQECHKAYQTCAVLSSIGPQARNPSSIPAIATATSEEPSTPGSLVSSTPDITLNPMPEKMPEPASQPIISSASSGVVMPAPGSTDGSSIVQKLPQPSALVRQPSSFDTQPLERNQLSLFQRQWVDLSGQKLSDVCEFDQNNTDEAAKYRFKQIAMSWPSFPATIFTYAALYISFYLCFVGTARPFRIITCILVMATLLAVTVFDATLVKDHFNHWEDVAAGAILALVVVSFVLLVYLNKFKDSHYYENQKLFNRRKQIKLNENFRGQSIDVGPYNNPDKPENQAGAINVQNGDTGGSISNNDLAMRYFQIPRANYRGAPRPLSSMNQMR